MSDDIFAPLVAGFVDMNGKEITLEEWAARFADVAGRTLAQDTVTMPDGHSGQLRTVWLGYVDNWTDESRAFGTAIQLDRGGVFEIETYDTKAVALDRHGEHLQAIRSGHHCAVCREHEHCQG
jgi:hypothetical protein